MKSLAKPRASSGEALMLVNNGKSLVEWKNAKLDVSNKDNLNVNDQPLKSQIIQ
jgi:hypothetical protein